MEKFLSLPAEKQNGIIDAALGSFGANGYKKTSVMDIAAAAGISKAAVFFYFGTKRDLYFYLINFCGEIINGEIGKKFDPGITDFFERILLSADIEIAAIQKHPSIFTFLNSVYFESDQDVAPDIQAMLTMGEGFRNKLVLDGLDTSKFKDGIDPRLVMKILIRMTEGFITKPPDRISADLEAFDKEFKECMELFRRNFYKEEYLP